jgi:protein-disulfide isomerase
MIRRRRIAMKIRLALAVWLCAMCLLSAAPGRAAAAGLYEPPQAGDDLVATKSDALWNDPASPVMGNPHGDVTLVVFFDYACPYCKAAEPRLIAAARADKRVRIVMKEFPILTPASFVATKAALASVKQGKYAPFHLALMGYNGLLDESVIFDTAKRVGIDVTRLRKDMASTAILEEVIANFNLARSLRIFQTPAFIAGTHIIGGPSAAIDFPRAIAAARAARRG